LCDPQCGSKPPKIKVNNGERALRGNLIQPARSVWETFGECFTVAVKLDFKMPVLRCSITLGTAGVAAC